MSSDRPALRNAGGTADLGLHPDLQGVDQPDPVDLFEDELARRLGHERPPAVPYDAWRRQRVAAIESAGSRADLEALRLEEDLASR